MANSLDKKTFFQIMMRSSGGRLPIAVFVPKDIIKSVDLPSSNTVVVSEDLVKLFLTESCFSEAGALIGGSTSVNRRCDSWCPVVT